MLHDDCHEIYHSFTCVTAHVLMWPQKRLLGGAAL